MLPQGWQPFSGVLRGDNFPVDEDGDELPLFDKFGVPNGPLEYINFAGIEPIGAFIGITVAATDLLERSKDPTIRENIWAATLAAGLNYIREGMPFVQGIAAMMKTIMYDDITHLTSAVTGSMIGPFPLYYSSAIKNVGSLFDDPYARRPAGAEVNF